MKSGSVSNSQTYSNDFQDWEIAIVTKLVLEFQQQWTCLKGEEEFEDLRQECLLHWFIHRNEYDKSKGANQKTFMSRVISNFLMDMVRERRSDKRKACISPLSLNTPIGRDNDDSPDLIEIIEQDGLVQSRFSIHDLIEFKVQYSQIHRKLNQRQRDICDLTLRDYTIVDIAKILGIPRTTLNDEIKRIKKMSTQEGLKDFLK